MFFKEKDRTKYSSLYLNGL